MKASVNHHYFFIFIKRHGISLLLCALFVPILYLIILNDVTPKLIV
jgi:hypothetical protein